MKSIRHLLTVTIATAVSAAPVLADLPGTTGNANSAFPPGSFLLQAVALLVVVACVLAAMKFYTSIRGGRVGRGWLWLFCGFLVFAAGQVLLFAGQLGVLPLFVMWVDTLRVVSLLLFFIGINKLRKIMA